MMACLFTGDMYEHRNDNVYDQNGGMMIGKS